MCKRQWLLIAVLLLAGCGPEGYTRIDPGGEYAYSNPAWSPDSQQIAYTRCALYDQEKGRNAPSCELFVMTLASRETQQLTHNEVYDGQPDWSPDGQQLVYRREDERGSSLRVIGIDGSRDSAILACPQQCQMPAWSPRADVIAFQMLFGEWQGAPSILYLIQADGGDLQPLTQGSESDWRPRWSPDGAQIVFHRAVIDPIRIIDVTTRQETICGTNGIRGPAEPSFTPDGSGIIFSAYDDMRGTSGPRLFRRDRADGSIGLLLAAADDYPPEMKEAAWSPDGKQIVFSAFYEKLYLADWEKTRLK